MNALWFSRHQPSAEQLGEIATKGFTLVDVESGVALGARSIESGDDCRAIVESLLALKAKHSAKAVFGVFPTPILGWAFRDAEQAILLGDWSRSPISLWAAWNVTRTPEGGKPTFCHKTWQTVGVLTA